MQRTESISSGARFADRYVIQKILGRGGMGEVYLALDSLLENTPVALKILSPELAEDGTYLKRFLREIQLTRKVTHANVARTYEAGTHDGLVYFVMEYVKGSELNDLMGRGPMPMQQVASILCQVCEGLEAIHQAGIVHRDLKPANIMLSPDGTIKITDFGIARTEASNLTSAHDEVLGSAPFMAPEIWNGDEISPATDMYALGVMTYEMITGRLPFDGSGPAEFMYQHLNVIPVPPASYVHSLPDWMQALILNMLAKDWQKRISSAREVGEWISRSVDGVAVGKSTPIAGSNRSADIFSAAPLEARTASQSKIYKPAEFSNSQIMHPTGGPGVTSSFKRAIESVQSTMIYQTNEVKPSTFWQLEQWLITLPWNSIGRYSLVVIEALIVFSAFVWFSIHPLTSAYEYLLNGASRGSSTVSVLVAIELGLLSVAGLLVAPVLLVAWLFLTRTHSIRAWAVATLTLTFFLSLLFFHQLSLAGTGTDLNSATPFVQKALASFRRVVSGVVEIPLLIPFEGLATISAAAKRVYPEMLLSSAIWFYTLSSFAIYYLMGSVLERLILRARGRYLRHWSIAPHILILFLIVCESAFLGIIGMGTAKAIDLPWIGTVQQSIHYRRLACAGINWGLLLLYFSLLLKRGDEGSV